MAEITPESDVTTSSANIVQYRAHRGLRTLVTAAEPSGSRMHR